MFDRVSPSGKTPPDSPKFVTSGSLLHRTGRDNCLRGVWNQSPPHSDMRQVFKTGVLTRRKARGILQEINLM